MSHTQQQQRDENRPAVRPPTPPHRGGGRQAQETRDVQRYLQALFGRETRGALIDLRWRYRGGMSQRFLPHTDTYAAARAILRLALKTDVYIGVAPRRTCAGGKDAIERVWALWADLDDPDATDRLERLPVAPGIQIASGSEGHSHCYWLLAAPVSVQAAEQANRRLAAELGADSGAVTNGASILRPPGSFSYKTKPPTPVVLERFDGTLSTIAAVTAGIAADPATPTPAPSRTWARVTASRGVDPLRDLDPALYVGVLTGQTVGRSRKISCPFQEHEDRTASFHVYENPDDGWFCFGCRRFGHTVYELAGALWHLETRGPDFLELRGRLYELFLPGDTPPSGRLRGRVTHAATRAPRPPRTPAGPESR